MRAPAAATAVLLLLASAAPASEPAPGEPAEERAGDTRPFVRLREWFFSDARPDPVHEKYEELFGSPYPEEGFHSFEPLRPYQDVQRFNEAFDLALSGARSSVQKGGGRMVVWVEVPDSGERPVEVRVDEEKVVLSYGSSHPPRKYFVAKRDEHVVRLPERGDPDTAQVVRSGDSVRVFIGLHPDEPLPRPRGRHGPRSFRP